MTRKMHWLAGVALAVAVGGATPALAADAQGSYSARGLGAQPCRPFITAIESNNAEVIRQYVAWIDGALSANNRLRPDTFDSSPFVAPGAFAGTVLNACRRQPDGLFDSAVNTAIGALVPIRVQRSSPVVEMQVGEVGTSLRQETLMAVQTRLRELRLMTAAATGNFGEQTREALVAFQAQRNLPQTGLPDPDTIVTLLLASPPPAAAAPAPAPAPAPRPAGGTPQQQQQQQQQQRR